MKAEASFVNAIALKKQKFLDERSLLVKIKKDCGLIEIN